MMSDVIQVVSSTIEQKILHSCSALIAAFFPGKKMGENASGQGFSSQSEIIIEKSPECGNTFEISFKENNQFLFQESIHSEIAILNTALPLPGKEPLFQILVKRALFIFLTRYTKELLPWGILTGIRPGKLVSKMEDLKLNKEIQFGILTDLYMVCAEKAKLLQTISGIQRPYLLECQQRADLISLYLTIPFCPSRCFYCSFPSQPLAPRNRGVLQNYLEALFEEVQLTGEMMNAMGLKAGNIYIGGGTPTILNSEELEKLFQVIRRNIRTKEQPEYTVEAGRPDTIDYAKLLVMKNHGVNRLSINPQSMQDRTLRNIGRNHRVSDVLKCYRLARELSDWVINMDLILGLPEEGFPEMRDSVEKVLELGPDNLTVHALALKKGSLALERNYTHNSDKKWLSIQQDIAQRIQSAGLNPYYLYRQKYIVGNLENVGYALPGKECRYNMAIIEEKQNIIGLGAGAASKILNGKSGHVNLYNPVDINYYLAGFRENHVRRKRFLQEEYNLLTKKY